ncbi:STAS domain-containing protein [Rhizobium sp. S9]|uniref:STAS domain-containing protein n=1 Tax=unclassified Rhizobium TaxID=2613769 RepID=UPI000A26C07E|nr:MULTISPECIES: STAS domain-containing protein [unclassified Rhizobium]PDS97802.1 STAS domain-containing protein [Rhizobium sp. S9]
MDTQSQYCEPISLAEALNIRHAAEIHSKLSEELRVRNGIVVSIPADAEVDLSFIQLMESARRQAKSEGKTVSLSSPASGSVLKVLERAGFIESFDHEDLKFWLHKEVTL